MNLNFVNDATGASLEAEVEPTMTADAIVNQLVAENIIAGGNPWQLFCSGKGKISGSQTIGESGFSDGDTIQLQTMPVA